MNGLINNQLEQFENFSFFSMFNLLILHISARKIHLGAHIFQNIQGIERAYSQTLWPGKILPARYPHHDLFALKFKILGAKSAPT